MGYILDASCSCGFTKKNILFGGVKSNHQTVLMLPAISMETGAFEIVNYYEDLPLKQVMTQKPAASVHRHSTTPKYIFYNDPTLSRNTAAPRQSITWRDVTLLLENNFCPECKGFTMNFRIAGMAD